MRVVLGQDGASVARVDALALKPDGDASGHTVELAVGDRLQMVPALDLDGRALARARDGGGELVEEVSHGGVGAGA